MNLPDTDEARTYLELRKAADMAELREDFDEFMKAELICAGYAYKYHKEIFGREPTTLEDDNDGE